MALQPECLSQVCTLRYDIGIKYNRALHRLPVSYQDSLPWYDANHLTLLIEKDVDTVLGRIDIALYQVVVSQLRLECAPLLPTHIGAGSDRGSYRLGNR